MPPWQFIEAVQGANTASPVAVRRITFAAPTKMRAGDQLVVLLASMAAETVSATSAAWDFVNAYTSPTRGLAVYRRVATDDEPASYTFDLGVSQETIGALLVYRGLDNVAAIVGGSGVDFVATQAATLPNRTLVRTSDLYLGATVLVNPGAVTMSAPIGATERFEASQSALGVDTLRMQLLDARLDATGTVGKIVLNSANASGAAFSIALAGAAFAGSNLGWSPVVMGSIGLPVEGI